MDGDSRVESRVCTSSCLACLGMYRLDMVYMRKQALKERRKEENRKRRTRRKRRGYKSRMYRQRVTRLERGMCHV